MMPGISGIDLLQQIKENDPSQLVMIMTGFADKDVILRALKAHADDFIPKPINLLQLKSSIKQSLEKKALQRELTQLKQMDRMKADFLGLISHKLRTPTTSISLFIQNLANGSFDPDDPGFSSALTAVKEESDYLAYLIEDLLYYSDIILQDNLGKATREDLQEIALAVMTSKKRQLEQKNITLQNNLSGDWPIAIVDRQRITFTLSAILDNAIKFSPEGSEITISGSVEQDQISLMIADNGPGIPSDQLPKVFEKFYQVDPLKTGQVRGFGLGLFYARQFIRDHGGNVNLESRPGEGLCAKIILPRQPISATD
jgi:signal transduction histidine kinase